MRLALTYNLREDHPDLASGPHDVYADWEPAEAMAALRTALERLGHDVLDVGDPRRLLGATPEFDLVFNVAEMTGLRYREALAPALFELLGIPYTLSPPDAMVLSLDKNASNLLVRQAGGAVPDWAVARDAGDPALDRLLDERAGERWIVKPLAEGSSMGIAPDAVCEDAAAVRERVAALVGTYSQPAIVQRFLAGRELTVGVVEVDGRPRALPPLEVDLTGAGVSLFHFPSKEALGDELVRCLPVAVEDPVHEPARRLAELAFEVIGCRDAARVDVRCDEGSAVPWFLELNALPGLDPVSAEAFAMDYGELLTAIVDSAARRHGIALGGVPAASSSAPHPDPAGRPERVLDTR